MALGQGFEVHNNGVQFTRILSSGGNTVIDMPAGLSYKFTCVATSGTSASSWDLEFVGAPGTSGSGNVVLASNPTIGSPDISGRMVLNDAIILVARSITSSGGTTAISATTDAVVIVTGTLGHTLTLPTTSSASVFFWIRNSSTQSIEVNTNAGSLVAAVAPGQIVNLICLVSNGGSNVSDWSVHFLGGSTTTGTGASVFATSPTLVTPALGVATATSINSTTIPSSATLITSDNKVTDLTAPTSSFSMNSQKITSLATPADPGDAATKGYVDGVAEGLDIKASCRLATTVADGNIGLSGLSNIDGVTPLAGDRILVKNQTTESQNGIYVADSSSWSRASDASQNGEITPGTFVFVEEGSQADSGWVVTTNGTITIGATAIVWTQFSGAGQITAGTALTKTGNTLDVDLTDAIDSTSTTTAATPNSVKQAYDLANAAVPKSLVDAKGDLIVATAADTVTRLPVGATTGHVLTVDPAEAAGIKWAAAAGGGGGAEVYYEAVDPTLSIGSGGLGITPAIGDMWIESDVDVASTSAQISIGTVTTGAAGSSATVTNTGTGTNAVLAFSIPQGAVGATGPAGATGATGATGANAYNVPIITQATSRDIALTDLGDLIECTSASAMTLTVRSDSTVPGFTNGDQIMILQSGAGQVTIAGNGATINGTPGLKLRAQWSSATLIKRGTNLWVLVGDTSA
jgi:hypothetical protein